ncbi:MAG: hypothetical protein R2705_20650 [Ilumatobacteraceae bacterium]
MTALVISCDTCSHQHSAHCADCLVTAFCDRAADEAVVLDLHELRATRLLARAGLIPDLAHEAV